MLTAPCRSAEPTVQVIGRCADFIPLGISVVKCRSCAVVLYCSLPGSITPGGAVLLISSWLFPSQRLFGGQDSLDAAVSILICRRVSRVVATATMNRCVRCTQALLFLLADDGQLPHVVITAGMTGRCCSPRREWSDFLPGTEHDVQPVHRTCAAPRARGRDSASPPPPPQKSTVGRCVRNEEKQRNKAIPTSTVYGAAT